MMPIAIGIVGILALLAGFLLIARMAVCRPKAKRGSTALSVIIPARNEERSLPRLLDSLRQDISPAQVIVVDDHSTDRTAQLATEFGVQVVSAPSLPAAWTGKTWACAQGAAKSEAETLLFVDADTWFAPGALTRIQALLHDDRTAVSVLPYHITERPYEELSLFFNLLMAFGAGGFGLLGKPRLFGQSMLISRALYERTGGHQSVRGEILENFALAVNIDAVGGRCVCAGGAGVLMMRMFPNGLRQLREGWTKAFAAGAAKTTGAVLAIAVFWLTVLCFDFLCLLLQSGETRVVAGMLYLAFAFQIAWMARLLGTFRFYTCILYPVSLFFFFAVFADSAARKAFGGHVTWRGRQL